MPAIKRTASRVKSSKQCRYCGKTAVMMQISRKLYDDIKEENKKSTEIITAIHKLLGAGMDSITKLERIGNVIRESRSEGGEGILRSHGICGCVRRML